MVKILQMDGDDDLCKGIFIPNFHFLQMFYIYKIYKYVNKYICGILIPLGSEYFRTLICMNIDLYHN